MVHTKELPSDAVSLRIGVFFDGTGNNRENAVKTQGLESSDSASHDSSAVAEPLPGSYGNAPTNVALLYELYRDTSLDPGREIVLKTYVEGIGTTNGAGDSSYVQATGRWRGGIEDRVAQAGKAVADQIVQAVLTPPGVRITSIRFDLFGFSRGAAAARHFANELHSGPQGGVAKYLQMQPHLFVNGFSWRDDVEVAFVGLLDTVAGVVSPLVGDFNPGNGRVSGLRLGLGQNVAGKVVQLVAADEHRANFSLVRTDNDILLPGAHSDVGGGYLTRMRERVRLCKPCSNRVSLSTPIERTAAYKAAAALLAKSEGDDSVRIETWEKRLEGDRRTGGGPEKQVFATVVREREVLGHLSRVALRIMYKLATQQGVPLMALDEDKEHLSLPQELQAISRKLEDYACTQRADMGLTSAEQTMLSKRYIHTSAHWNPPFDPRNTALDVFYVNRPAEGGRVWLDNV